MTETTRSTPEPPRSAATASTTTAMAGPTSRTPSVARTSTTTMTAARASAGVTTGSTYTGIDAMDCYDANANAYPGNRSTSTASRGRILRLRLLGKRGEAVHLDLRRLRLGRDHVHLLRRRLCRLGRQRAGVWPERAVRRQLQRKLRCRLLRPLRGILVGHSRMRAELRDGLQRELLGTGAALPLSTSHPAPRPSDLTRARNRTG